MTFTLRSAASHYYVVDALIGWVYAAVAVYGVAWVRRRAGRARELSARWDGALVWNDAAVEDVPAAQNFYREVSGFRFDELPDMGGYATFATDGEPLGGLGGSRPGTPPGWTTCFAVASTNDGAIAKSQAGGGTVTMPATDTEFGRFAVVGDPWGAPFSVMQAPPG